MSNPVIITAALTGASTMKEQNPAVPYTAEEFITEAIRCEEEGAAIVHIHARHPETGQPTSDLKIVEKIVEGIRKKTNLIINLSTGVRFGGSQEERIRHIREFRPEIASLNTNTINMSFFNRRTGELLVDHIFYNSFGMIRKYANIMRELSVKPELEVYDIGHVHNVLLLQKSEKLFAEPLHFNFVFGIAGAIWFKLEHLVHFVNSIPPSSSFCTTGVGIYSFQSALASCAMGGHIRVGLEDNIYLKKKVLAKGSYELVKKAKEMALLLGRKPASPDEARKILNQNLTRKN